jgi:hypothetical protein
MKGKDTEREREVNSQASEIKVDTLTDGPTQTDTQTEG